jgi:hypothetical protein
MQCCWGMQACTGRCLIKDDIGSGERDRSGAMRTIGILKFVFTQVRPEANVRFDSAKLVTVP